MERKMKIILVLLSCTVYQVQSANVFVFAPCYAIKDISVRIQHIPEDKYLSHIYFYSNNFSAISDVWKPCKTFDPPLTNDTLQQIREVLKLLHLTSNDNSCDRLNKLIHLTVENFPLNYYYNPQQIGKDFFPVIDKNLCGSDLEGLTMANRFPAMKTVVRNASFCEFKKLKYLNLSSNNIWDIEVDAFICLEHLIEINLQRNNLSSLLQRVFCHNQRLQTVILAYNNFNSMVFSSFQPLTNLSFLDLSQNEIEILPEVILCKRLKSLDLSDNELREITKNAFSELAELEDIDLSGNELREFHSQTLRNNPEVKSLKVGNNSLKSIPKVNNLSKLEVLDLSRNQISEWINFSDLLHNHTNLVDLRLHRNEIEGIVESSTGSRTTKYNPKSQTTFNLRIDLSHNRIQSLMNVILPNRVCNLDVRYNRIQTVCLLSLDYRPTLDSTVENVLWLYGNPLQCNCVNRELKLPKYGTKIGDFNYINCDILPTLLQAVKKQRVALASLDDDGSECRIEFNRSEQCVCYGIDDCSSNPLNGHCYAVTDILRSKITHLCEHLTEIPSRGYYTDLNIHSGHFMYFNENNIEKLNVVHFNNDELSIKCVSFYLEKSNVRIIESGAFNRMTNLEVLSLRHNRIRVLPDHLFRNLTKLKELYLSNNILTTLTGPTIISNIMKLELHSNSLTHLPIITNTNQLLLSFSNLFNLSLHDNPWSCDCQFIQPFHNYLGENAHVIHRVNDVRCADEQRNSYNALQFDLSKCKPLLHLTAIVTSTVVIVIIVVLVFVYRREVRVLIYSRYRLHIFGPKVDDDVSNKQYDAFMAYSRMDEDFLVQQLMPGLEAIPNPYRLCIHERDFPAGAFIQDSIMEAVRLSSRTIVLLSQNFVDSGWCRLEFMTAHAQMLQDRCPRVLLIVLGEIPRTLDPEMELYLRTNTYLRWGERLFWDKLYYAMPDQRVTSPATGIMPTHQL